MIINNSNLQSIFYQLKLLYGQAFDATVTYYKSITTPVASTTKEGRYPWLATLPALAEWVGPRQYQNLSSRSYSLINRHWQAAVEVNRDDIEDDQLGLYSMSTTMLGQQAAIHPDLLTFSVLQAGTTNLCYDGNPFFYNAHPVNIDNAGFGTFSNLFTGRGLTPANLDYVRTQMRSYVNDSNQPFVRGRLTLVVPPALETTAFGILNNEFIAPAAGVGGSVASVVQSNPLRGTCDLIVSEYLTGSSSTWYLLSTGTPIKPLIYQTRKPAELVARENPADPSVFENNTFRYGIDMRDNVGYTIPQLAACAQA